MSRPVIALLTDFGTRDHYVAAMKGVILGICPEATLVDITHGIAPQDVRGAALELEACAPYFPPGTIFLVVVDPGVGSHRRAIALASAGVIAVGPDNGVLTPLLRDEWTAVALQDPQYARPAVSRTFEGRDRFAPAAAWLATGVPLDALGSRIVDPIRIAPERLELTADTITATVVRIDRFGNVITNLERATLEDLAPRGPLTIAVGAHRIEGVVATYADVEPGRLCTLIGSSGQLEIAVNGGNAAERTGARRGDPVVVRVATRHA